MARGSQRFILIPMPRRRKLLLLAGSAVALLILAVVGFVFRYNLAGWVRGEAKFKGKYTSELDRSNRPGDDIEEPLVTDHAQEPS